MEALNPSGGKESWSNSPLWMEDADQDTAPSSWGRRGVGRLFQQVLPEKWLIRNVQEFKRGSSRERRKGRKRCKNTDASNCTREARNRAGG